MRTRSSVPKYVLDTNLYVRATRDDGYNQALESFFLTCTPEIYLHSVVAMEVLSGATSQELEEKTQERFIRPLERRARIITPSHGAWKRAGGALAQLLRERKVSQNGIRRSLLNDLLIAASARDHGFILVTDNGRDFQLVEHILPLEFVPPWPDCSPTTRIGT
jgi:predicted nucleic acid-binding protein